MSNDSFLKPNIGADKTTELKVFLCLYKADNIMQPPIECPIPIIGFGKLGTNIFSKIKLKSLS
jgi:hypothetical protein